MKATVLEDIKDTLLLLDEEIPYTQEAFELVSGTMAHESVGFKYRKQLGGGPALGLCQMEPFTFNDCVESYLVYRPDLYHLITEVAGVSDLYPQLLETNDRLATCMCRVRFLRAKGTIPTTLEGQANYWKQHYNTYLGKGTVDEYLVNYNRFVLPNLKQN